MTETSKTPELDKIFDDTTALNLLDTLGTPITVADPDMVIRYVNRAAMDMFRKYEADIRADLPAFSLNTLVGTCVDAFHKTPSHQRGMVAGLRETYNGKLTAGGRHYDFMGTPKFNADGDVVGIIVEWYDNTENVKTIEEGKRLHEVFKDMSEAHDRGDIEVVADSEGFSPAFAVVVDAVNDMVTKHIETKKKAINFVLELANGNFDAEIEQFPRQKAFINDALERIRASFKGVVAEVETISTALVDGNFDINIDLNSYPGAFREVLETMMGIIDNFNRVIDEVDRLSNGIVQGNLDTEVDVHRFRGSYGSIMRAFEAAFTSLNSSFNAIQGQVNQITSTVEQMSEASQSLASNSQIQSSSVDEVSSSTEQTESQVKSNANAAASARDLVVGASVVAADGKVKIGEMVSAMDGIRASSQDIAKIIKVIDEIAFQTNLLALNAAVEAARAGQHGRGFAVVAQEVRNLAGRSAKAARETSELIESASSRVQEGVRIADETSSAFTSIVDDIEKVRSLVGDIASASDEQSRGVAQINVAVSEIAKSALVTSQQADELAASAAQMQSATESMTTEVARFNLRKMPTAAVGGMDFSNVSPDLMAQIQQMIASQGGSPVGTTSNSASAPSLRSSDRDERGFGNF